MPKGGEFYVVVDSFRKIRGYLLNHYEGKESFINLRGDSEDVVAKLLDFLPQDSSIDLYINTDPIYSNVTQSFLASSRRNFEQSEDLLLAVRRGEAKLVHPNPAVKIPSKYVRDVAYLITDAFSDEAIRINGIALDQGKIWGIILNDRVVSLAGIASRQPEVAFIVNVNTATEFRRKGYGTFVVSAATEEALATSEAVSLYVESTNRAAIALYEKLGYRLHAKSARFKVKHS
jgi:ribosomal protein S18 acetylase RimI-like enzyme